jgi:hypothetical protein
MSVAIDFVSNVAGLDGITGIELLVSTNDATLEVRAV